MSFKIWKLTDFVGCFKEAPCPCCGQGRFSFSQYNSSNIIVNVVTKAFLKIPKFWRPIEVCDNQLCEWSKVKINDNIEE